MNFFTNHIIFCAVTWCTALGAATSVQKEIASDLQNQKYDHLGVLLKENVGKKIRLGQVKSIAKKTGSESLLYAVQATQNFNMKNKKKLGLSRGDFLQTALYIETRLSSFPKQSSYYIPKSDTDLEYDLEYDRQNKAHFIVLDLKRAQIGTGKKKVVAKAIYYDRTRPQIIARAEQTSSMAKEMAITKLMQGKPGIFETYGFGKHKSSGKKHTTIYSKLYRPGSLEVTYNKGVKLSLYEKIKAALNILKGLESLHSNKIVHRDLGARNYLINVPRGKPGKRNVEAVIADLGRADFVRNVRDSKVQGNTTYTAPEGLYRKELKRKDYYKTDIFAVGCTFYRLCYGPRAPWQDRSYVKDTRTPITDRYHEMVYRINLATQTRRSYLAKKSRKPKEEFEYIILRMLNPNPKKRGTAKFWCHKMENLFTRVQ